jgi:hypothetical protein
VRLSTIPAGVSRPDLGLLPGTEVLTAPATRAAALAAAVTWIRDQQWASLGRDLASPADITRWVDEPLDVLSTVVRGRRARAGLAVLRRRLGRELAGQVLVAGDVHGDPHLGRWWFTDDAAEIAVVDAWQPVGRCLPETDVVLVALASEPGTEGHRSVSVAGAVRRVLEQGWTREEAAALGVRWADNQGLRPSTLILLAWLQTVAGAEADAPDRLSTGRGRSAERRDAKALLESFAPSARRPAEPDEDALRILEPVELPVVDLRATEPPAVELPTVEPPVVDLRATEPRVVDLRAVELPVEIDLTDGATQVQPRVAPTDEAGRSGAELTAALVRAGARSASRRATRRTVLGVALGSLLWLAGTWHIDPSAMTDLGLLSILRPAAYVGLAVLLVCFAIEVAQPHPSTARVAAPLVALVAALHGTPAWLYGTLRYSWAWKHLGILDYIHRHGHVNPKPGPLDVYQNWPGFFAVNSALTDLFGLRTAVQYARWWPVMANLLVIPVLLFVYRSLRDGADRRAGWIAVAVFLVSNWIGQDYFSPQSMSFLLHLVIIGVVLRRSGAADAGDTIAARRWSVAIALVAAAAVVTSHQVTPFVLVASLLALTAVRRHRVFWVLAVVVSMAIGWALTGARTFVTTNVASLYEGLGEPVSNADGNLVDQGQISHNQVLVSTMGRLVLVAIVGLAVCGMFREWRRGRTDRAALVLTLAPGALLCANKFGGEIGFRSYLFALPFLAWYAALALRPLDPADGGRFARSKVGRSSLARSRPLQATAVALATMVLLSGFLFGYFGKDQWYRFTSGEVAASDYVLSRAPQDSLLVTVTANYPGQFRNYEHLTYVPIASEPGASRARLLDDPARVLAGWLGEGKYRKGYILITKSQEYEVDALGVMPRGSVSKLRHALERSPRFRVAFSSPDAQVFVLADR